jgi:hypothetical protein
MVAQFIKTYLFSLVWPLTRSLLPGPIENHVFICTILHPTNNRGPDAVIKEAEEGNGTPLIVKHPT